MLLFMCFLLPFLLSLQWFIRLRYSENDDLGQAAIPLIVFTVILVIASLCIFTSPIRTRSEIRAFNAFKSTLADERKDTISYFERASLTKQIIEENQWLAEEQFWAKSLWLNWCYDKDILKLTPIK